jgi:gluconate 2-dehydrogenase alpha chain
MAGTIMADASKSLGYHPFQAPSSNASEVYTNFEGQTLGACEYCGHCERFGCEANAKASPNVCILPALLADQKFELRTHAQVKELVYDKTARKVTAVRYVDTRSGEEYEQPAGIVILGAYVFNNVLLMLTAGIGEAYDYKTGKGAVGKNYCYQVSGNAVTVFFQDKEINPFMAAGAHGVLIDDFNGDNFDHGGLGFFGGAWIQAGPTNGRPIATRPVPPGTPRWGRAGAANGKRRRRSGITTPSRSARPAATMRTAKISWISIRLIATRSAGRSFACRIISATTTTSSRTMSAACSGSSPKP